MQRLVNRVASEACLSRNEVISAAQSQLQTHPYFSSTSLERPALHGSKTTKRLIQKNKKIIVTPYTSRNYSRNSFKTESMTEKFLATNTIKTVTEKNPPKK